RRQFDVADQQRSPGRAGGELDRGVVAQGLLDAAVDQLRLRAESGELIGVAQQREYRVGDQVGRRLVAGDQQQYTGREQLVLGQLVALGLGVYEQRQQIVAR